MIKFKFNSKKLIPNLVEYGEIILSVMFVVYIVKGLLIKIFPVLNNLTTPWDLIVWVCIIVYLKELIDIKIFGNDFF